MRLTKVAAVAAVLAFSTPAVADLAIPSGTYLMDPTHTSVHFKVSHMGLSNYTARFTEFKGALQLDSENPENSTLEVTVYPMSVRTDYPNAHVQDFDKELRETANFMDAKTHPEIVFTSTKMTQTSPTTGTVEGDLTFRGVTLPVTLEVVLNGAFEKHPFVDAAALGISATGQIKRSDFGMTHLIPDVGDEVQIIIESEFFEEK